MARGGAFLARGTSGGTAGEPVICEDLQTVGGYPFLIANYYADLANPRLLGSSGSRPLVHHVSAVRRQRCAYIEAPMRTRQQHGRRGNLLGTAEAVDRQRVDERLTVLRCHGRGQIRDDRTWRNGVHPHTFRR